MVRGVPQPGLEDSSRKSRAGFGNVSPTMSHSVYIAEAPHGEIAGYGSVHWLPICSWQGRKVMCLNCSFGMTRADKGLAANC